MATWTTASAIGQRENLSNVITRVDPSETPLFSNAKKEVVKAVTHEWQVQELASASATNYVRTIH